MSESSGRLPVNGGHLLFESSGDGPNVILLHGFGLDFRMWDPQFEALSSNFRVIRYDLRGFGRSSLPHAGYSHEDDLMALLSHLGTAPAHVVGLSMGARMALRFAVAYPESVRTLVLADSALDGQTWSPDWQTRWSGMCDAARAGRLADAKRQWLEHPLFDLARAKRSCGPLLARMVADYSGWHWHNRNTARVPSPPLAERLGEIRAPALVVTGAQDIPDFQPVGNLLAEGLRTVRRLIIHDCGHMVNLEAPREFNEALLTFWQESWSEKSVADLPRRSHRLRRHVLRPRPQPPDQPAADNQPYRNQLRARHRAAEHRPAARIVAQKFQKKSRHAVNKHERTEHLAIEFSTLQQPHQEEEIRQLHRRLEQLRRLERHVERSAGNRVCQGIRKHYAPEMMRLFPIAASRREAADASNCMSQGQPWRKRIASSQRGHVMPAYIPGRRQKRGNQAAGKNSSGLQRGNAENIRRDAPRK